MPLLALRLPYDDRTTDHAAAAVAVSLPVVDDATLIAIFGAWLARITAQREVPLRVTRGDVAYDVVLSVLDERGRTLAAAGRVGAAPGLAGLARPTAMISFGAPGTSTAELQLVIGPAEARLLYNARAFRAATALRFAAQLATLGCALAADLDAPIAHLPLLASAEARFLDDVGRGGPPATDAELAPARFARLALAEPAAIAVRHRAAHLTYGELATRVNQLARRLVATGASGARIAVCVEPGLDIAVALLGVLGAGAVYVPLDPAYPAARLHAILGETRPAFVITHAAVLARLDFAGYPTLVLDEPDGAAPLAELPELAPEAPASIYFTSGTTGAPKGVLATHANLAFYLQAARDRYGIDAQTVMPALARFSFSISMFELLSPLTAGGTLVVLDREHVMDPARMRLTLREVTLVHAGPSLWKHLLPHLERAPGGFPAMRHASSGGDLIAPELLARLSRVFASAEVFVIYGSSEISCMGCTYAVDRDALPTRTYVGRPFPGVTVCVLDAAGERAPVGVVGEVYFAGAGVVAGYADRPALTAERFVLRGGQRFYAMGDVGRWSPAGELELLGRNDFQIKIRGMRVELGEVDLHLRRAPGVADAVVVAQAAPGGETRMVGYVVLATSTAPATQLAAIRRHLVDTLPDYMVPAQLVPLAALPVNHNLKLDRNALPALAVRAAGRAPESPTERALAALWCAILGCADVGLDDQFFELGGDSLLALDLIGRAQATLGVTVTGMDILRESLAVIAADCDRQLGRAAPVHAAAPNTPADRVTAFHFGPRAELFGVLHGEPAAAGRTAVLVVPPIGQERVRTQFVLARLARQLAAAGAPTLRFDFFGQGDSRGEDVDATLGRWRRDIVDAHAELITRTGAARVVAIGCRLGATLLATTALPVARMVLWDPVARGMLHHDELAGLHAAYLRAHQPLRFRRPRSPRGAPTELLGTTYSLAALRELDALALPKRTPTTPSIGWLATTAGPGLASRFAALAGPDPQSALVTLDVDCAWHELAQLEEMLPDLGISRALAELASVAA